MKNILLLEDDYILSETIKELLEDKGYSVDVVYTSNDAIEASYVNIYNIYIFDINLPDITGLELLDSLRKADDNTPTIFISALIDMNSIAKAFEVGADDYIKKPFFPQELLIRINARLSDTTKCIEYNNLKYISNAKELYRGNELIVMGSVQQCLCHTFMNNIGNVLDKVILMDCLLKPSSQALRVALNKLQRITGLTLKNVRGIGYILEKK